MLRITATILDDPPQQHHDVRDPNDSYLVTLARSATVDYLVSGDGDLTSLQSPQPPVIKPADFLVDIGRSE
jgi:predicted nucleic acid-binding protein